MDYGINILVVDDSRAMRMTIKVILKRLGFMNIVEAEDGRQGLDVLNTVHIDLILCDWMMPVMTGLEMLKELQKDPEHSKIPFVIVTAVGNKESIIEAVQAGVSNYIVKPFAPDTLEGKIKACFTNKNKLKLE